MRKTPEDEPVAIMMPKSLSGDRKRECELVLLALRGATRHRSMVVKEPLSTAPTRWAAKVIAQKQLTETSVTRTASTPSIDGTAQAEAGHGPSVRRSLRAAARATLGRLPQEPCGGVISATCSLIASSENATGSCRMRLGAEPEPASP
eukprot:Amastigsp_a2078_60.p1 type:complete len:148 gc:universal Amastigsp_a2078_60:324-767(+)